MPKESTVSSLKVVVIGKHQVGKTSMISTYRTGEFPGKSIPQAADYEQVCELDGREFSILVCDSVQGEKDHRIRPLSYAGTDVFILLFDVRCSEEEFRDLRPRWWPELKYYCSAVPVILVASKIDMREILPDIKTISTEKGVAMAEEIGAVKYMEMSSLKHVGVREIFDEAIRIGFSYHSSKRLSYRRSCLII